MTLNYEVESADDVVVVAAGRFENCLRVRGSGRTAFDGGRYIGTAEVRVEQLDGYAPGLGLVRAERRETTTSSVLDRGGFVMELEGLSGR